MRFEKAMKTSAIICASVLTVTFGILFIPAVWNIAPLLYTLLGLGAAISAIFIIASAFNISENFTLYFLESENDDRIRSITMNVTAVLLAVAMYCLFSPAVLASAAGFYITLSLATLLSIDLAVATARFNEWGGIWSNTVSKQVAAITGASLLVIVTGLFYLPAVQSITPLFYLNLGLGMFLAAFMIGAAAYSIYVSYKADEYTAHLSNQILSIIFALTAALLTVSLGCFFAPAIMASTTGFFINLAVSSVLAVALAVEAALFGQRSSLSVVADDRLADYLLAAECLATEPVPMLLFTPAWENHSAARIQPGQVRPATPPPAYDTLSDLGEPLVGEPLVGEPLGGEESAESETRAKSSPPPSYF